MDVLVRRRGAEFAIRDVKEIELDTLRSHVRNSSGTRLQELLASLIRDSRHISFPDSLAVFSFAASHRECA